MKLTATYPLPIFGAHTPHYRYFFNGQEADNEVYGEEAVLERGSAIFKISVEQPVCVCGE